MSDPKSPNQNAAPQRLRAQPPRNDVPREIEADDELPLKQDRADEAENPAHTGSMPSPEDLKLRRESDT